MLDFMRKRKYLRLYCCVFCGLILAGCWDRVEIENRGYVLGMAIDHAEQESTLQKAAQAAGERKYKVSYELKKFRKKAAGDQASGGGEENMVYAAEGESILATIRAVNTQIYFNLFLEDNQVILISESVAREGIKELMDFLQRDPESRRKAKVYITTGRAEDFFKVKPISGEIASTYISKMVRAAKKAPTFSTATELGYLLESMYNSQAIAIPMLIKEGDNIKATKAAVFNREYKMVGVDEELQVIGGKILRRKLEQGVTVVPNPADPDKIATFELYEPKVNITPHLEGDKLWFTLDAKFIGNVAENQDFGQDAMDPEFLAAMEQEVAETYTRQVYSVYHKLQDFKADVVELGPLVHHKYPKYWKKIKDRWDEEIFPTVPLEVNIKVVIRNVHMSR